MINIEQALNIVQCMLEFYCEEHNLYSLIDYKNIEIYEWGWVIPIIPEVDTDTRHGSLSVPRAYLVDNLNGNVTSLSTSGLKASIFTLMNMRKP